MAEEKKGITLSLEKEQELLTLVCKNYNDTISSAWRTRLKTEWDDFHKMYLGKQDPSSFPWTDASNLDLGIVEMCVDNLKSRYKLSTIGANPMFNVIPVTEAGEEFKQRVCDSMVYILDTDIDIDKRLDLIAQRTVEFGTCIAKLFWKKDMIEKKEYQEVAGVMFPADKVDIEEKGCLDVIDLEDIIVPEGAESDINKLPWIYHRVWYSLYDLEKKVKMGIYTQDAVDKIKTSLQVEKEAKCKTAEEKAEAVKKLPEERVEILECYQRFSVDGKLEKECIFWVCPRVKVLMKGFYLREIYFDGARPFYRFVYKDTGSFYGRGIPEMLKPYRKLLNDVFNFSTNCLMLQILPWGFYRLGSSFKPEEVRLAPGVMIPVDDINDVRIAQFPVNATAGEGFVRLVMSFIERQTGISSPQMGKEFPTRKTATEVKTIISEGNVKHEDRIQVFQDVFSDVLGGIYSLYRQNQSAGRKGRITGNSEDYHFIELFSALDQMPDYNFIILGTLTTGNKTVEREDAMALYQIGSQSPIIAEYPVGQLELLKDVFSVFGKRNSKKFLPPDEIIKAISDSKFAQVKQAIQQQQMGGQPGQQPPQPQGPPNAK